MRYWRIGHNIIFVLQNIFLVYCARTKEKYQLKNY